MNAIRRKNFVFAILTGLGIFTVVMFLVFGGGMFTIRVHILLAGAMVASTVVAGFWLRGLGRLKIARLIAENPILHISTAVISDISVEAAQQSNTENCGTIVSYFGVLMDERIIKFNQGDIWLRAVEIGGDFISCTYGTKKRVQNIRLLRPIIDREELEKIAEKFRYETGITPIITSS